MNHNVANNYLKDCACGCGKKIWAFSKYDNGRVVEIRFVSGHAGRGVFPYWNTKKNPAIRTSRRRAMDLLRRVGRTTCDINNQDCSKKKLESHHIDGNPLNNDMTNLVPLCIIHHQIIERRKISVEELKNTQLVYIISSNKRRYRNKV